VTRSPRYRNLTTLPHLPPVPSRPIAQTLVASRDSLALLQRFNIIYTEHSTVRVIIKRDHMVHCSQNRKFRKSRLQAWISTGPRASASSHVRQEFAERSTIHHSDFYTRECALLLTWPSYCSSLPKSFQPSTYKVMATRPTT